MTQETGDPGTLAKRLDFLFNTVHPKDRGPYSYKEVEAAINETAGERVISSAYIWQLRKGERTNPSAVHLAALAKFFGVKAEYFTDDAVAARTDQQWAVVEAMRDQGVEHVALRAAGLSPTSLATVLAVIESVRKIDGLPGPDEPSSPPDAEESAG